MLIDQLKQKIKQWITIRHAGGYWLLLYIEDIDSLGNTKGKFIIGNANSNITRKDILTDSTFHSIKQFGMIPISNIKDIYDINDEEKTLIQSLDPDSSFKDQNCNCPMPQLLIGGCICGGN